MKIANRFEINTNEVIFYLIGLLFTVLTLWAYFAEIDQVVRAEAQVEPVDKVQQVQSRYPGSVKQIKVSVGDLVTKGQILLTLDKDEVLLLLKATQEQVQLIKEEQDAYKPLVEAGIEPKIRLIKLKQQLVEAVQKLDRYNLQLTNSDIPSPVTGVITAVNVSGNGAVLKGGEVLMEVVPQADYFIVKAKLLPKDMGKVYIGQKTRVSYTAYDFSRFGVMEGTVTKIAQNTTKTQQGEIYYDAWIKTSGDTFKKSGIKPNILPGMIAQVDMLGEKRTVLEYIASPLNRTASKAFTEQ